MIHVVLTYFKPVRTPEGQAISSLDGVCYKDTAQVPIDRRNNITNIVQLVDIDCLKQ